MVLFLPEKRAQGSQFALLIKEYSPPRLVLSHRNRERVFWASFWLCRASVTLFPLIMVVLWTQESNIDARVDSQLSYLTLTAESTATATISEPYILP